jgi:hypothetical protein
MQTRLDRPGLETFAPDQVMRHAPPLLACPVSIAPVACGPSLSKHGMTVFRKLWLCGPCG